MTRKKAYICSPLSSKTAEGIKENMRMANQYAQEISQLLDCRAVAVHGIMPELLDDNDPVERALALEFGKKYLATCDMLVVCGNRVSSGMSGEIEAAYALSIPIYIYLNGNLYTVAIVSAKEGRLGRRRIHNGIHTLAFSPQLICNLMARDDTFEFMEGIDLCGI